MKVLLPPHSHLSNPLEQQILKVLRNANLDGYALLGFCFRELSKATQHEIDALLILKPGIFVCLEAKNYSGTWTGSANGVWKCDGKEINAVGTNPFTQVTKYALIIKNRLQEIFDDTHKKDIFVNSFIVAPDKAIFNINGCRQNTFQPGKNILVCHVSKLESTIRSIRANQKIIKPFGKLGCEAIVRELIDLSVNESLESFILEPEPQSSAPMPPVSVPKKPPVKITESSVNLPRPSVPKQPLVSVLKSSASVPQKPPAKITRKPLKPSYSVWGGLALIVAAAVTLPKLPRIINYFRLTRIDAKQLTIGSVTPEKDYQLLNNYLTKQTVPSNFFDYLSGQDVKIVVQAAKSDRPDPYPEGIAKIRNHQWDIAFSYSPVIGLIAEDNGYKFAATMFPGNSSYQASFFVRADSPIEFNKLSSNYRIALGDFFSASKFYMPVYDLYGSSLNVVADVNSKDIFKLVEMGQADIGVGVITEEIPKGFKVIKQTRDLPGSGLYLSPNLSESDVKNLKKVLLDAPEEVKKQSNYDAGNPPNFEYFRGIVDRVKAVSACSNFEVNPVAFTCGDKVVTTIQGKVDGVEVANVLNKLSIAQDSGSLCNVLVKDSTLRKAINYTSIFNLQGKHLRFYVGLPKGESCSSQNLITIYQPNQIEIVD